MMINVTITIVVMITIVSAIVIIIISQQTSVAIVVQSSGSPSSHRAMAMRLPARLLPGWQCSSAALVVEAPVLRFAASHEDSLPEEVSPLVGRLCQVDVATRAAIGDRRLLFELWLALQRRRPSGLGVLVGTASALSGNAVVLAVSRDADGSVRSILQPGDVIHSVRIGGGGSDYVRATSCAAHFASGGLPAGPVELRVQRDVVCGGDEPAEEGQEVAAAALEFRVCSVALQRAERAR